MDKIELVNLVPKFLDFYQRANRYEINEEQRWSLWESYYGFAAIPPGKEGAKIARLLLEKSWGKYQDHLNYIKNWTPNFTEVEHFLSKVKSILEFHQPIDIVVVYFVGGFENNAFVAPYDNKRLALCLPIENGNCDITIVHELTHIVHSKTANLKVEWERTIASTVLQEGLAMHVSKFLVPGEPDENYVEHKEGWFASCRANKHDILKGILPYLENDSSEIVTNFTFGNGTTNNEREAYFVGWEVVQYLLETETSFKEIARIQENNIPNYLREVYPKLIY